jgi:hypothetical protein
MQSRALPDIVWVAPTRPGDASMSHHGSLARSPGGEVGSFGYDEVGFAHELHAGSAVPDAGDHGDRRAAPLRSGGSTPYYVVPTLALRRGSSR